FGSSEYNANVRLPAICLFVIFIPSVHKVNGSSPPKLCKKCGRCACKWAFIGTPSPVRRALLKKLYSILPTSWCLLGFYAEATFNRVYAAMGCQGWIGGRMRVGNACDDACVSSERCYCCRIGAASYGLVCGGRNADAREE